MSGWVTGMSPLKEGHFTTETRRARRKHQSVAQDCSMMTPSGDGQNTDLLTGQVKNLRVLCASVVSSLAILVESGMDRGLL